jgi:hypothetical protein
MPGGGHRFGWIGKPTVYWTVLVILVFLVDGTFLSENLILPRIGSQTPNAAHPYALLTNGRAHYVSPSVGWFFHNALWISWISLFLLFAIMFVKREQVRKAR